MRKASTSSWTIQGVGYPDTFGGSAGMGCVAEPPVGAVGCSRRAGCASAGCETSVSTAPAVEDRASSDLWPPEPCTAGVDSDVASEAGDVDVNRAGSWNRSGRRFPGTGAPRMVGCADARQRIAREYILEASYRTIVCSPGTTRKVSNHVATATRLKIWGTQLAESYAHSTSHGTLDSEEMRTMSCCSGDHPWATIPDPVQV